MLLLMNTICERCGTDTKPAQWYRDDGTVEEVRLCVRCQFSKMEVLGGRFINDEVTEQER